MPDKSSIGGIIYAATTDLIFIGCYCCYCYCAATDLRVVMIAATEEHTAQSDSPFLLHVCTGVGRVNPYRMPNRIQS